MNNLVKCQWSIKLDNGEIFVAQADTWEEIVLSRTECRSKLINPPSIEKPTVANPTASSEPSAESICKEHNVPMTPNKNGKLYHRKYEDGKASFCNGFGWH